MPRQRQWRRRVCSADERDVPPICWAEVRLKQNNHVFRRAPAQHPSVGAGSKHGVRVTIGSPFTSPFAASAFTSPTHPSAALATVVATASLASAPAECHLHQSVSFAWQSLWACGVRVTPERCQRACGHHVVLPARSVDAESSQLGLHSRRAAKPPARIRRVQKLQRGWFAQRKRLAKGANTRLFDHSRDSDDMDEWQHLSAPRALVPHVCGGQRYVHGCDDGLCIGTRRGRGFACATRIDHPLESRPL